MEQYGLFGGNENGELGNGEEKDSLIPVQVKINENEYLTNVIKISAGSNHVLALTKEGKIYAWGSNGYGELGQNNKENSRYAKPVLAEGGEATLSRIVDISAGTYSSTAINEFGWVYTWGSSVSGTALVPAKNTLYAGVSISQGSWHTGTIIQNGNLYTYGTNSCGELGVNNVQDSKTIQRAEKKVIDVSFAGRESIIRKVDKEIYACGENKSGELGTGTTANTSIFTKVNLSGIDKNEIKYIKARTNGITVLTKNGEIYTCGLSYDGASTKTLIKAKGKEQDLSNMISIGRRSGEQKTITITGIHENGRVYACGSNEYGALGDGSKISVNYFKEMMHQTADYKEKIRLYVGEIENLTNENFKVSRNYLNVYREDKEEISLVDKTVVENKDIATYENGDVTGVKIRKNNA